MEERRFMKNNLVGIIVIIIITLLVKDCIGFPSAVLLLLFIIVAVLLDIASAIREAAKKSD
jgi:hypothetical protein